MQRRVELNAEQSGKRRFYGEEKQERTVFRGQRLAGLCGLARLHGTSHECRGVGGFDLALEIARFGALLCWCGRGRGRGCEIEW